MKWSFFLVICYHTISKVVTLFEAWRENNAVTSIIIFSMWITHCMLWWVSICHLSDSIVFQRVEIPYFPWCFMTTFTRYGKCELMWIVQIIKKLGWFFFILLLHVVGQEYTRSMDKIIRSSGDKCFMTWNCLQVQY